MFTGTSNDNRRVTIHNSRALIKGQSVYMGIYSLAQTCVFGKQSFQVIMCHRIIPQFFKIWELSDLLSPEVTEAFCRVP